MPNLLCSLPPHVDGGNRPRYQAPKTIRVIRDKKSLTDAVSAAFEPLISVSAITLSGLACEATPVSFDYPPRSHQRRDPTNR